ncbi:MAG: transglycosylase SLT domain-containing protein [Bryobacteraceae bacterium]
MILSRRSAVVPFLAFALFAPVVSGINPSASTRKSVRPKPPTRPPLKMVGGAGLIAGAQYELDRKNYSAAVEYAKSASSKAPALRDYAEYLRAQAEYELKNFGNVGDSAKKIFDFTPASPLVSPAAALAVRADLDGDRPQQALALMTKYADVVPQPENSLLLARCYQATGDLARAADYFQRVYYEYPTAKEAADAANALVDLQAKLGDALPRPTPKMLIGRAQRLFDAKDPGAARLELAAAIPQLTGAEQDLARVRLGIADFLANHVADAFAYLSTLKVNDPEADAERLNYLVRCARKPDRHAEVRPLLTQLEQLHPTSKWRLDTLIYVADQARTDNDPATFVPLYQACATSFATDPRAAHCHWRLAFQSYHTDGDDAYDLLRSHIRQYANSEDINDALYFLGRLQERKNDAAGARACYDELQRRYPNTYYALVARERLKAPNIQAATPSAATREFLDAVEWPARPEFPSFSPGDLASTRISRSQALQATGLNAFAEGELKFGAANDGDQANVYAYELAKLADERKAPDQALRYIKHYAPGYLYMPFDQAPVKFWQLAFPIPYRYSIDQRSREQSLDPFFVAALIRQESEFNAAVISHANAYGLMQVLPTTGRQLARRVGVRRLAAPQLLAADRNIQLGTMYVRDLMNTFGGQEEYVLASYNAGPGRARLWQTWGPFREQAEFVETIPFHETRTYVQVVLRNADTYRRLYAGTVPEIPAYRPKPAPKQNVHRKRPVRRS